MRIAVLGFGQVGRMLCRQASRVGLKIVAVADSSGGVFSTDLGFTPNQLETLIQHKEEHHKQLMEYQDESDSSDSVVAMSTQEIINRMAEHREVGK